MWSKNLFSLSHWSLAFALSLDAAMVMFTLGMLFPHRRLFFPLQQALLMGLFQTGLLLVGVLAANWTLSSFTFIETLSNFIVGAVFLLLAVKCWLEGNQVKSFSEHFVWSLKEQLALSFATAIDAMAAGLGLAREVDWKEQSVLVGVLAFVVPLIFYSLARSKVKISHKHALRVSALILFFLGVKSILW